MSADTYDTFLHDAYADMPESEDTSWSIRNLEDASWASRKAAYFCRKTNEIDEWEKQEIDRIKRVASKQREDYARRLDFFEFHLGQYLRDQMRDGHPTKSLTLPGGKIQMRARPPLVDVGDSTAAVQWAQDNEHKNLLRVKVDLDKAAFKKFVSLGPDNQVFDPSTGEVLTFARWEDQADSVTFSPEE